MSNLKPHAYLASAQGVGQTRGQNPRRLQCLGQEQKGEQGDGWEKSLMNVTKAKRRECLSWRPATPNV